MQQVINTKSKNNIKDLYQKNLIDHEIFDFDEKLLIKAVTCDLAITRSGASSIAELSYLNIPFVAIRHMLKIIISITMQNFMKIINVVG